MKDDLNESGPKGNEEAKSEKKLPRHEEGETREENLDKTIEDSFPASDPPSSIPDPDEEEAA